MADGELQPPRRDGAVLTHGSVGRHLFNLAAPMAWGIFAVIAFNVADTYFVGQLGTEPLAALSFTFPVVLTVMSLALGLGIGVASVLARAIGGVGLDEVKRLTTDSLLLATVIVIAFVAVGLATIEPLFRTLGAEAELLPLIREYMIIWYLGMPFLVVPMVGNNAIRASGDARFPSLIMTVGAAINVVLDPILIFGWGPVPALGIQGAAIASVIARAVTLVAAIAILHYRMGLIAWTRPSLEHLLASARRILHVALPAAATNMINPLSVGAITAIVAQFGSPAVAGFGVATRIEAFAIIPLLALTAGLGPIVGQNWGADNRTRVHRVLGVSAAFCLAWGLLSALILAAADEPIARLFDDNPDVVATTTLYLWIVPISFAGYGVLICVNAACNAAGRPLVATTLMALRAFGLYVPGAWLGGQMFGLHGVFAAAALSSVLMGLIAWHAQRRVLISAR